MNWDALQLEAKSKGTLVFAMDQAQTAPMTQPGPWGTSTDGYCIGLAATWISWCYAGQTFPVSGQVCDYPPWQATRSQTMSDAAAATDWTDRWKAAAGDFLMTPSDSLRSHRNTHPTGSYLHAAVTKAYGCYGVTLERSGGAHAIAMRHGRDNRIHLFDANYGHFAVKDHTLFSDFMTWYLDKSGYKKRYDVFTGVLGIRPPITT